MTELAKTFNGTDRRKVGGAASSCGRRRSRRAAPAQRCSPSGWRRADVDGPQPVIWSPAASAWGAIVNQRLIDKGQPAIVRAGAAVHAARRS